MFWSIMTSIKKMGVRDVMCNLIMIIYYQSIVACIHVVTEGQLHTAIYAVKLFFRNIYTCTNRDYGHMKANLLDFL